MAEQYPIVIEFEKTDAIGDWVFVLPNSGNNIISQYELFAFATTAKTSYHK